MPVASSKAGHDTFEDLNIDYERAYGNNPLKKACIEKAIALVQRSSKILDVGCGTGKPVSEMLSNAGFEVVGIDISPKMVEYARSRVKGTFIVADALEYNPSREYAAVVLMFSFLQLPAYADFHDMMLRYTGAIQSGGYLILGTQPADHYVTDKSDSDETGSYAVDYPTPFMGENVPTFFLTSKGMTELIVSLGFAIVYERLGEFQPNHAKCVPEHQQYVIARCIRDEAIQQA